MNHITIAYEPVWAIGTGKTASSSDAEAMHKSIRNFLAKKYNKALADSVRILYGGSVKPENISELMAMENIDGALVGGASLKAESFIKIINY
jgi:triosephosphate isomerase